eukprot:TRINITY_DN14069_c0_g1_i4.p1 TRINITY_DN14069_c0_g1~~TRINITY_DN14069_c0_g1_i4.p1  ORF type:complete len:172 (+),score=16.72 TRINITY_DN14069_c0_g1_i4:74-589(+)
MCIRDRFPITPNTRFQLRGLSQSKNFASTYTVEGKAIHSLNHWAHLEAGLGVGTFPSIYAGACFEPTSNCLLGCNTRFDLSSIKLGPSFTNELFWKQQIGDNSNYMLKYQFDQQHRLGAKWTTKYFDGGKIGIRGAVANKVAEVALSHKKQLTDNLSLKVVFPAPLDCRQD